MVWSLMLRSFARKLGLKYIPTKERNCLIFSRSLFLKNNSPVGRLVESPEECIVC